MLATTTIGGIQNTVQVKMMDQLFADFLSQHDIMETTRESYKKAYRAFKRFVECNNFIVIDKIVMLKYKEFLKGNHSPYSVNTNLGVISVFFNFLDDTKRIGLNPMLGVKKLSIPRGFNKDSLTESDVKKLLESIDRSTLTGKRDYAIIKLMVQTGIRTKEVVSANFEDIRPKGNGYVLYVKGKGQDAKADYVVLKENVLDAIREYKMCLEDVKDSDPLFKSFSNRNKSGNLNTKTIRQMVKLRLRDIGIISDKISAHSLRHTAVTLSIEFGATLQEAQSMARHRDINTTMIYSHNYDRMKNSAEDKLEIGLNEALP